MVTPIGRFVDVAEEGRHLSKERGFLVVEADRAVIGRVPLDDLAAVMATARGTTVSVALLSALAERGIPFVVAGANFVPNGLLWPLAGHHAASRRMEAQIHNTEALSKVLWQQTVATKIRRQGWALKQAGRPYHAFDLLARQVRPGDEGNREAQAARRYWPLLLGQEFRRDTERDGINALLNYGYAVLRAAVARALCAVGLHPGIGIFHRHPENPMPLADDVMEPYRPTLDHAVRQLVAEGVCEVTAIAKRRLVAVLLQDEQTAQGTSPLMTAILRTSQSLADSYLNNRAALVFPFIDLAGGAHDPEVKWLSNHVDDPDVRSPGNDQNAT